ncbi:MAG: FtsW/RodA/SpoVE family cell cycle protein, partial [Acidimicrobiia bacterium]|nr:FtsW/RodA/SpoVE family cell cycle protein [Acidimicrobiia bacterium]
LGLALVGMALPFVSPIGVNVEGAQAWIRIGSITMQPSELLKVAVVIAAADLLARRVDVLHDTRRALLPIALLGTLAAGSCLVQGDLGAAIVLGAIVLGAAFIGGLPLTPLLGLAGSALAAMTLFVISSPRRMDRFTALFDITGQRDHRSYQTYQGFLSIANGGVLGSGIGEGKGKLGYLPLAHSDFMFAVIADELGLIGAFAVLGGFGLLAYFGVQTALAAPDRFGMVLAGGISVWFAMQTIVNVGGVTGLLPVTGLTLPFFSVGGTSLFVSITAAGLLLNVARRAT